MSLALAGRFLTTGLRGKSQKTIPMWSWRYRKGWRGKGIYGAVKAASTIENFTLHFEMNFLLSEIPFQVCMRSVVEELCSPLNLINYLIHRLGRGAQRLGWNSLENKEDCSLWESWDRTFHPIFYSSSQPPASAGSFQPESQLKGPHSWVKLAGSELLACQDPYWLAQEQRSLVKLNMSANLILLNSKWPSTEGCALRRLLPYYNPFSIIEIFLGKQNFQKCHRMSEVEVILKDCRLS